MTPKEKALSLLDKMERQINKMSIKTLQKRIDAIEKKKGVISNEEIQELVALRNELSYKVNFN